MVAGHLCVDMRIDMCVDMRTDMSVDMCVDMRIGMERRRIFGHDNG